jgi:hypothetical protein
MRVKELFRDKIMEVFMLKMEVYLFCNIKNLKVNKKIYKFKINIIKIK